MTAEMSPGPTHSTRLINGHHSTEEPKLNRLSYLEETRRHHGVAIAEEIALDNKVAEQRAYLSNLEMKLVDTREERINLERVITILDPDNHQADDGEVEECPECVAIGTKNCSTHCN